MNKLAEVDYIMQKTIQKSSSMEDVHSSLLLMENERKVSESSILTDLGATKQTLRET